MQDTVKKLIKNSLIQSAHDISEGGLFISLLESAMAGGLGFDINTDGNIRKDAYLFGESQSRVVVSIKADQAKELQKYAAANGVKLSKIGTVTADSLTIDGEHFGKTADWKVDYDNAIGDELDS